MNAPISRPKAWRSGSGDESVGIRSSSELSSSDAYRSRRRARASASFTAILDVVLSLAAFTLARALEVREELGVASTRSTAARRTAIASAVLLAAAATAPQPAFAAPLEMSQQHAAHVSPAVTLRENMRKLWTDHVVWTRGYIVAAVAGTPDAQGAATRLMNNQEDIGAAVATVYGADAGAKLNAQFPDRFGDVSGRR